MLGEVKSSPRPVRKNNINPENLDRGLIQVQAPARKSLKKILGPDAKEKEINYAQDVICFSSSIQRAMPNFKFFANIYHKWKKKRCKNYKAVDLALEKAGVVEINNRYSNRKIGAFSKSMRYNKGSIEWEKKWIEVETIKEITKATYSGGKYTQALYEKGDKWDEEAEYFADGKVLSDVAARYLIELMDYKVHENAYKELEERLTTGALKYNKSGKEVDEIAAYNRIKKMINSINANKIYFKQSKEYGRIFHSINGLDSWVRKYLVKNGERVTEIDIKSSHPYFLTSQIKEEKKEDWIGRKDKYSILVESGMSREESKKVMMRAINGCRWNMGKIRGVVEKYIKEIDTKKIFLEEAEVMNKRVNVFDSVLSPICGSLKELTLLFKELLEKVGAPPSLKISGWRKDIDEIMKNIPEEIREFVSIEEIYDNHPASFSF